jgi:hypothetical protein
MRIQRSINEPIRDSDLLSWEESWKAEDNGLIFCWEQGRSNKIQKPDLAAHALKGELIPLGWKGGVSRKLKNERKFGTLFYLAMWQGLRGENLDIDTEIETTLTCTATGMEVVFTGDISKYGDA